jgi:adenine-specific DNA-methyltransferase
MHDPAEPSSGFLNPPNPIGIIDAAPETRSMSASAVSMPVTELAKDQSRAESRALAERRILGAYYTPERLSQMLSDWAIRAPYDTVLEPSFGGCGFLATARTTLARLGCTDPVRQIHGCDIDPVAFEYLTDVFGSAANIGGFVQRDFLDCDAIDAWPRQFSVVLANPPYIPHHRIGKTRVRELWKRPQGVAGVKGRASLWAYFLSHAVNLLQPGGRMAWVLPGAFLQADYAAPIRAYLGCEFARSAAFVIHERLFLTEGADEETVILLAEGHGQPPIGDGLEVGEARTLAELETLIAQWAVHGWAGRTGAVVPAMLSLTDEAQALFDGLIIQPYTVTLGAIAKVQIGLVTGDNAFFVLDRAAITRASLVDDDCTRILSKFRAVAGISLTIDDLDHYDRTGGRSFLVQSSEATTSVALQTYLDTYPADRRDAVSTFRKRPVWSAISDGKVPHAFFPVMHHDGPRLVLNTANMNCTNTIHRVFFKDDMPVLQQRLAALSMLTTFSQISAELCGRRYGSGVLKHEPRDADRIHLMMPDNVDPTDLERVYWQADARSREGDTEGVRAIADVALWRWSGVVLTRDQRDLLDATLAAMRARRRPDRRITPNGRSTSGSAPSNH